MRCAPRWSTSTIPRRSHPLRRRVLQLPTRKRAERARWEQQYATEQVIELRDRVALVFEFVLMGQRSELVALELHDLTETPDGLEVLIPRVQDRPGRPRCRRRHSRAASTATPTPCGWCALRASPPPAQSCSATGEELSRLQSESG